MAPRVIVISFQAFIYRKNNIIIFPHISYIARYIRHPHILPVTMPTLKREFALCHAMDADRRRLRQQVVIALSKPPGSKRTETGANPNTTCIGHKPSPQDNTSLRTESHALTECYMIESITHQGPAPEVNKQSNEMQHITGPQNYTADAASRSQMTAITDTCWMI
jgi:hypothetical protein